MQLTSTPVLLLLVLTVLWYLWRRLVRACEAANEVDWGSRWLNRIDGLNRLFCRRFHRLQAAPVTLPEAGGALLAANHVSGLDPLLMYAATRRRLHFIIAREQYDRLWLRWLFRAVGCIPVERARRPEQALLAARRALEAGEVVALFPHGKIHLDNDPPVRLKGGVAWLASRTGCPIYALHIEGVRGTGMVVAAVFRRSHARLSSYPPIHCVEDSSTGDCLQSLRALIEGRARVGQQTPASRRSA